MKKIFQISFFLFLLILIAFTFWDLPKTFFQQDEWWTFGLYNRREGLGGLFFILKDMTLTSGKVHFTPFSELGYYLMYKLFGLYFPFYAFVGIFIHALNTVLVYILIKRVVKNKFIAFLSSLLFSINSISHQALTWIAASINTQGMTLFTLLSLIFFMQYLQNKMKHKKFLYFSYFFIIVALLFKETLVSFLLLPVIYVLYSKDKNINLAKKTFIPLCMLLLFYLLLRLVVFISAAPILGSGNVELIQAGVLEHIYRLFALPFRVIAQSLLPANTLLFLAENLLRLAYPQFVYPDNSVNPFIKETIGYDVVGFFATGIILILAFFSYTHFKEKNENFSKGIILFLLITIFSAVLVIFIPGKPGFVSLIEPRHLYPGSFGSLGLLVLTLFGACSFCVRHKAKLLLTAVLIPIYILHVLFIRNDIKQSGVIGKVRRDILYAIEKTHPKLPKKVSFYIKSDTTYYGMPDKEKILPVQVGFGWMLMTWYHNKEQFPACLYDVKLFLGMLTQAYKECEGRGFGYFRDYAKLEEIVKNYEIPVESIIAFSWNGREESFTDITKAIREKLLYTKNKRDLDKK